MIFTCFIGPSYLYAFLPDFNSNIGYVHDPSILRIYCVSIPPYQQDKYIYNIPKIQKKRPDKLMPSLLVFSLIKYKEIIFYLIVSFLLFLQ